MKLNFRAPRGNLNFGQDIPLGLYIHTPWCEKKCPYCDFNSHPLRAPIPETLYLEQLLKDLENTLPAIWGRRISTIFIGGGTPSLLSGAFYEALLAGIRARVGLLPDAEITLEANPGSAEVSKFAAFRDAGINRISIGAQSFSNAQLKTLGRIHDRSAALEAFAQAKAAGFTNINCDIMFALPGQSVDEAMLDLQTAIDLETSHLSWYQLTLEPNTAFHHQPPPHLPDEGLQADIFETGLEKLSASGFSRYEISAYHRDKPCYHNIGYWSFGDYVGIGAGAHGKLSRPDLGQLHRTTKPRHPKAYLEDCEATTTVVAPEEIPFEFMLGACRLKEGFTLMDYESRTGLSRETLLPTLAKAQANGWVAPIHGDKVQLTDSGYRLADSVVSLFLKDD